MPAGRAGLACSYGAAGCPSGWRAEVPGLPAHAGEGHLPPPELPLHPRGLPFEERACAAVQCQCAQGLQGCAVSLPGHPGLLPLWRNLWLLAHNAACGASRHCCCGALEGRDCGKRCSSYSGTRGQACGCTSTTSPRPKGSCRLLVCQGTCNAGPQPRTCSTEARERAAPSQLEHSAKEACFWLVNA